MGYKGGYVAMILSSNVTIMNSVSRQTIANYQHAFVDCWVASGLFKSINNTANCNIAITSCTVTDYPNPASFMGVSYYYVFPNTSCMQITYNVNKVYTSNVVLSLY
jgi:hypothetical protein